MPAKAKVTKEKIADAAFAAAREAGAEGISARTVSERLPCSTQPVRTISAEKALPEQACRGVILAAQEEMA